MSSWWGRGSDYSNDIQHRRSSPRTRLCTPISVGSSVGQVPVISNDENLHRRVPSTLSVLSVDWKPSAAISSVRRFFVLQFPPLFKLVVPPLLLPLSSLQFICPVQDLATPQAYVASTASSASRSTSRWASPFGRSVTSIYRPTY